MGLERRSSKSLFMICLFSPLCAFIRREEMLRNDKFSHCFGSTGAPRCSIPHLSVLQVYVDCRHTVKQGNIDRFILSV